MKVRCGDVSDRRRTAAEGEVKCGGGSEVTAGADSTTRRRDNEDRTGVDTTPRHGDSSDGRRPGFGASSEV